MFFFLFICQLLIFAKHRCAAHYHNKKRAQNLRWAKSWRRAHKKVAVDKQLTKKYVKKSEKAFKSFVGLSLEDLKARQTADYKNAQRQAAERAKKEAAEKPAAKKQVKSEKKVKEQRPKFVVARLQQRQ